MSERAFKLAVGGLIALGAGLAMLLGWDAWFAPMMECIGYEP